MKRRSFIRRGIAAAITVPTSLTPTKGAGAPSVRVGIMDGTLGLATNPEAVRYAAALGFESVQVTLGQPAGGRLPLSDPALQKQWRDAATRYKIKLSATYIDVLHTDCLKSSAQASAWIEEGLHATTALQAPILMLVFFGECALNTDAEQQAIVEPLRRLCPRAQRMGITLAIENTISAEANIRILEQVKSPALKVWYDIGNATNIGGFDIVREIKTLGRDRIGEFHIKDKAWLGEGKVEIDGAARAIHDIGYTGTCTLETNAPTGDKLADARRQLQIFLAALHKAGVGTMTFVRGASIPLPQLSGREV